MAATAINGIRHSKSGAKAGLVADWGFDVGWGVVRDMGWRGRRLYGDGIHLTVAHKREWSYGFKPDNKTVPLPCYPESPYDHQRESSTS